ALGDLAVAPLADGHAGLVTHALDVLDLPELALLDILHGGLNRAAGPALGAALTDPAGLAGETDELASLPHVVRNRLLHEGVLARLDRPDASEGVPVVGGRRGHDVDVPLLKHLPHVDIALHRDLLLVRNLGDLGIEHGGIRIADRGGANA